VGEGRGHLKEWDKKRQNNKRDRFYQKETDLIYFVLVVGRLGG
jgi:hypothetical protein